jgi:hypothetical protein
MSGSVAEAAAQTKMSPTLARSPASKCRDVLRDAIENAQRAERDLIASRKAIEDVRTRIRPAQREADEAGRAFEQARTGTGELLEKGAIRVARDRLADAEDECEALKGALRRLESDIEKLAASEQFGKDKVRAAVGMVICDEALDHLLVDYKDLQTQHREALETLEVVSAAIGDREVFLRVRNALAEPAPVLGPATVPPSVAEWKSAIEALGKSADAPLPKVSP